MAQAHLRILIPISQTNVLLVYVTLHKCFVDSHHEELVNSRERILKVDGTLSNIHNLLNKLKQDEVILGVSSDVVDVNFNKLIEAAWSI
jgi:hypothetical protein